MARKAFAFRDFDHNKFLQRPLFKFVEVDGVHFLKDNLQGDGKIFESLSPTDNVNQNEFNLKKLKAIQEKLLYYQQVLIDKKHIPRLIRFKRATHNLDLKKRAEELQVKYDKYASIITMIQAHVREEISELEKIIQQQNKNIFAQRLKQARQAKGLTQKELATAVDMTQGGYVSYEIARREPPLTTLIRLSKTLEKTTDWLLGLST